MGSKTRMRKGEEDEILKGRKGIEKGVEEKGDWRKGKFKKGSMECTANKIRFMYSQK
jgi:hypothetical protein